MSKFLILILVVSVFGSCASEAISKDIEIKKDALINEDKGYQFAAGEHIHWSQRIENDQLIFKVELAPTWMTYSQYNQNFIGPLPTVFTFEPSDDFELVGSTEEANVKMKYDKEANQELAYFESKGLFTQKIKIKTGEKFVIKGNINFMTCDPYGCEPPTDHNFEIEITP